MRRDIVYFNEANKLKLDAYRQVGSRCKLNIIDFNPDQHFWGHDLIDTNNFINLTFEDNKALISGRFNKDWALMFNLISGWFSASVLLDLK